MSDDFSCPFCESNDTAEVEYSEDVRVGRKRLNVGGFRKLVCSHCGSESVPAFMHDANVALVRAATEEAQGAVTVGVLRSFRETWNLSQREASAIFGAGSSSFAKWESGLSKLSGPSALLIQVAVKFPHIFPYLAKLAKVEVSMDCAGYENCFSESIISFDTWAPRHSTSRRDSSSHRHRAAPPQWGKTYAVNESFMLEAA